MICRNNQEGSNVGALHDPTVAPSGDKIVFWEVRGSDSIGYEGDLTFVLYTLLSYWKNCCFFYYLYILLFQ